MGEAKRRGTFEERKKQSLERQAQQEKQRHVVHPTTEMIAIDGDEGRPIRPHRSGGGRRTGLLLATMAAAMSIGSIK